MSGSRFGRFRSWVTARPSHTNGADQSHAEPAKNGIRPHRLSQNSRSLHGQKRSAGVNVPTALEVEFHAELEAVPRARHELIRWLNKRRVAQEITEEIALVVTELVTNAIEASPGPSARIEVEVHVEDQRVVLKVRDQGTGFPEPATTPSLPDSSQPRGRGLPIVSALMDGFSVRRLHGLTEVEVTRRLPQDHGTALAL